MNQDVHYDEATNRWYLATDAVRVKVYRVGETLPASYIGIKATTYIEAYENLTGHAFQF